MKMIEVEVAGLLLLYFRFHHFFLFLFDLKLTESLVF